MVRAALRLLLVLGRLGANITVQFKLIGRWSMMPSGKKWLAAVRLLLVLGRLGAAVRLLLVLGRLGANITVQFKFIGRWSMMPSGKKCCSHGCARRRWSKVGWRCLHHDWPSGGSLGLGRSLVRCLWSGRWSGLGRRLLCWSCLGLRLVCWSRLGRRLVGWRSGLGRRLVCRRG